MAMIAAMFAACGADALGAAGADAPLQIDMRDDGVCCCGSYKDGCCCSECDMCRCCSPMELDE